MTEVGQSTHSVIHSCTDMGKGPSTSQSPGLKAQEADSLLGGKCSNKKSQNPVASTYERNERAPGSPGGVLSSA